MRQFHCPTCGNETERDADGDYACTKCNSRAHIRSLPVPPDRRVGRKILLALLAITIIAGGIWFVGNAWTHAMESYDAIHCASNLRGIGQGIMLYAHSHAGEFPTSLADLQDIPSTDCTFRMADGTEQIGYVYIGAGLNTATVPPDRVIAYEPLPSHRVASFLYANGHVEQFTRDEAIAELNKVAVQRTFREERTRRE